MFCTDGLAEPSTDSSREELTARGAGMGYGLHLVLRLGTEEYPPNTTWLGFKVRSPICILIA